MALEHIKGKLLSIYWQVAVNCSIVLVLSKVFLLLILLTARGRSNVERKETVKLKQRITLCRMVILDTYNRSVCNSSFAMFVFFAKSRSKEN